MTDKIVTEAMKPCPFCGDVEELDTSCREGQLTRYVICWKCEAEGPAAEDDAEARKLWNTRSTAQEPALERERCDFCNYPLPAHSDICVAWHSQRSLRPPTGSQEPALDDDAELITRLRSLASELAERGILGSATVTLAADRLANHRERDDV